MEDLKEEADKLRSQSGFGLFLLKPTVATLPWGVETRGEMSQVLSLESRSPWATAALLPRHLQSVRSLSGGLQMVPPRSRERQACGQI